jgi:hypothetical protein
MDAGIGLPGAAPGAGGPVLAERALLAPLHAIAALLARQAARG